jgi:alpha-tubulin suppressor-like RCC1 family protein
VPVAVVGLGSSVADISVGDSHACAVTASGEAWCWGNNNFGELGNGETETESSVPVEVEGLGAGAVRVACGRSHSCALTGDGAVWCFGWNNDGQIGPAGGDQSAVPVPLPDFGSPAVDVGAAWNHTCAVLADGTVRCWGEPRYGKLGGGWPVEWEYDPVQVVGIDDAVAVDLGSDQSCILREGGKVACVGLNVDGRLGDGTWIIAPFPLHVAGF